MKNILTENKLVKNLRAYPVLHKRWCDYIKGVRELPEGFTAEQLFHDYLKVRRSNPEKRVSMSEYMIFGFYGLTTAQQKQYLTDVEATLLMRPYNNIAEPYLKSKVIRCLRAPLSRHRAQAAVFQLGHRFPQADGG